MSLSATLGCWGLQDLVLNKNPHSLHLCPFLQLHRAWWPWVLGSHRMQMFALLLLWWMLSGFRLFKSEESVNSLFNFPRQEISQKLT